MTNDRPFTDDDAAQIADLLSTLPDAPVAHPFVIRIDSDPNVGYSPPPALTTIKTSDVADFLAQQRTWLVDAFGVDPIAFDRMPLAIVNECLQLVCYLMYQRAAIWQQHHIPIGFTIGPIETEP